MLNSSALSSQPPFKKFCKRNHPRHATPRPPTCSSLAQTVTGSNCEMAVATSTNACCAGLPLSRQLSGRCGQPIHVRSCGSHSAGMRKPRAAGSAAAAAPAAAAALAGSGAGPAGCPDVLMTRLGVEGMDGRASGAQLERDAFAGRTAVPMRRVGRLQQPVKPLIKASDAADRPQARWASGELVGQRRRHGIRAAPPSSSSIFSSFSRFGLIDRWFLLLQPT